MGPWVSNVCVKIRVVCIATVVWKFAMLISAGRKWDACYDITSWSHWETGCELRHIILIVLRFIPLVIKEKSCSKGSPSFKPFSNWEKIVSPILGFMMEATLRYVSVRKVCVKKLLSREIYVSRVYINPFKSMTQVRNMQSLRWLLGFRYSELRHS